MPCSELDSAVSLSVFVRVTLDKFQACMIRNTMDCFQREVTMICAWFHDTSMVITKATEISQVLNFSCCAEYATF